MDWKQELFFLLILLSFLGVIVAAVLIGLRIMGVPL